MFVRNLTDGCEVDQVMLVREAEVRQKRDGREFLKLTLADRTGRVTATIWDGAAELGRHVQPGVAVRVIGRFGSHPRYGAEIVVRALRRPAEGSYDPADLLDGPPKPAEQMEAELRQLTATVRDPFLAELLDRLIGPSGRCWPAYREAPAAKTYHQAYRHGLLEHSLTVAQAVHAVSNTFPGIDHDVAVTGALLHDIGKLEAYATDGLRIEMTDAGRLQGEIVLGYTRVLRTIGAIEGFPDDRAEALLHIVLSHHGSLEHGSPVVPCTREATLVHFVDNLGGRLGSFDRLEKELQEGECWSGFDRALGGGAYFAAGRDRVPCEPAAAEAA
ncbi:3'-5' exoribonuclease YhaM family protein [Capillimicrobium parvum]|uniref:3'-5' exoribonuclease YhaM n=1 Tax=Capillimicrobium parvum TaxID=2884022 RepID=A0A9E6Y6C1_9ACTN|nr:HD domain-containing protein [Capillimicrobium parvum]UGS39037.1 3'-5' exoribonuclease YhaM [Capillimicrobium parvum]